MFLYCEIFIVYFQKEIKKVVNQSTHNGVPANQK